MGAATSCPFHRGLGFTYEIINPSASLAKLIGSRLSVNYCDPIVPVEPTVAVSLSGTHRIWPVYWLLVRPFCCQIPSRPCSRGFPRQHSPSLDIGFSNTTTGLPLSSVFSPVPSLRGFPRKVVPTFGSR